MPSFNAVAANAEGGCAWKTNLASGWFRWIALCIIKPAVLAFSGPSKTLPCSSTLIKFDALSPTNQTRSSVPMVISHGDVQNPENIFRRPVLIEELKKYHDLYLELTTNNEEIRNV